MQYGSLHSVVQHAACDAVTHFFLFHFYRNEQDMGTISHLILFTPQLLLEGMHWHALLQLRFTVSRGEAHLADIRLLHLCHKIYPVLHPPCLIQHSCVSSYTAMDGRMIV